MIMIIVAVVVGSDGDSDDDDDNNIIIIMRCNNNFNWKYWVFVGPKLSGHLGIRINGVRITEGPLYMDYC